MSASSDLCSLVSKCSAALTCNPDRQDVVVGMEQNSDAPTDQFAPFEYSLLMALRH